MPKYSIERKESVLLKLLSPGGCSITELSSEQGISVQTLYAWRNKARQSGVFMPNNKSSERWDKQTKFTVVLETGSLNDEELSAYCREKGLYPRQVQQWRDACLQGIDTPVVDAKAVRVEVRELKQSKKALERELRRKDKALAEAAALLVLAKKYRPLWGDEE
jgi:transposase-like protein